MQRSEDSLSTAQSKLLKHTHLIAMVEEEGVDIGRCQQSTHLRVSVQAVLQRESYHNLSGKILQVEKEERCRRGSLNPTQSHCHYWESHQWFA